MLGSISIGNLDRGAAEDFCKRIGAPIDGSRSPFIWMLPALIRLEERISALEKELEERKKEIAARDTRDHEEAGKRG